MKDKSIFIVIPVHNRKNLTRNCLISLFKQKYRYFEAIVVDDGSTDGTSEMIQKEFPEVVLLKGDGKLYWTRATNLGVEKALQDAKERDYILTLNNDIVIKPVYLNKLVDSAKRFPKSLIGSIAVNAKDGRTVVDGGVRINWLTAKFRNLGNGRRYRELINNNSPIQSVDVLPGRGTLIPVKVFKEIGLYNARKLPHYGADYELSIRAKRRGYCLLINYQTVIVSKIDATGLNNSTCVLTLGNLAKSYFSIRSPYNLYYRWNFSKLCCPWYRLLLFYTVDTIRVMLGSLRNQIFSKIKK